MRSRGSAPRAVNMSAKRATSLLLVLGALVFGVVIRYFYYGRSIESVKGQLQFHFANLDSRDDIGETRDVAGDLSGNWSERALESIDGIELQRSDHSIGRVRSRLPAA